MYTWAHCTVHTTHLNLPFSNARTNVTQGVYTLDSDGICRHGGGGGATLAIEHSILPNAIPPYTTLRSSPSPLHINHATLYIPPTPSIPTPLHPTHFILILSSHMSFLCHPITLCLSSYYHITITSLW